ncbi:signal peptidase I [Candidatus Daviesbacteria bacterium RIFOXYD1_FULL_41_10]|uniref:Signal peptidase I n=1 Tax=Candidatus Daviesbacteria bacterium RIFOXYD1_FULL_41_10 TaxID=1797801 RepID=A0A1F5N3B1_9BACT|nr:MAG: signal peptidase I [Candidatus Daviesbacteria bacterium RIFOXYD1_FULL_41_10]
MKKFLPWIVLGIIFVVFFIIKPVDKLQIAGQNMMPTYQNKQIVWLNKSAYWFGKPKRGDIVVFIENRGSDHYERIYRVIAIPEDAVKIQNGAVYLNSQEIQESYSQGRTEILKPDVIAEGKDYTLKDNEYFVLGDNRADSKYDSRSIGMVNAHVTDVSNIHTLILGKVFSF